MVDAEDAKYLVGLARSSIRNYFGKGKPSRPLDAPKKLMDELGVFVTLESWPEKELRGCIGYPEPIRPLAEAVAECAVQAAFHDPRFPQLERNELEKIIIEISVLTKPELVKVRSPSEYPAKIRVGRDGLIVRGGFYSGLLLPQVPVEWKWNETEFLSHTCNKAGLPPDAWMDGEVSIYSFQAHVFCEEKPEGSVVEKKLA